MVYNEEYNTNDWGILQLNDKKQDLSVFIDESGSITKTDISHNQYFIIAILFTRNSEKIKTQFRRCISKLIKNEKFKNILSKNGEIKGSEVSETKKKPIYDRILEKW